MHGRSLQAVPVPARPCPSSLRRRNMLSYANRGEMKNNLGRDGVFVQHPMMVAPSRVRLQFRPRASSYISVRARDVEMGTEATYQVFSCGKSLLVIPPVSRLLIHVVTSYPYTRRFQTPNPTVFALRLSSRVRTGGICSRQYIILAECYGRKPRGVLRPGRGSNLGRRR